MGYLQGCTPAGRIGASVIESAKELKPKAFSFDEVEGAEEVKDWEEIGKKLRIVIK